MPIDPSSGGQVLIASIQGETLTLICTLFAQAMGALFGLGLSGIVAVTWKG